MAPTVFVARPQRGQAPRSQAPRSQAPRSQAPGAETGRAEAGRAETERAQTMVPTGGAGVQRPPTSPYLPEGVVDTRPKGLAVAELQAAVRDAGFEYRPGPGAGEPTVVNGVLDARPVTGALSLGSFERPDLPPPVQVVDLRDSVFATPAHPVPQYPAPQYQAPQYPDPSRYEEPRYVAPQYEEPQSALSVPVVPVEVEAVLETETVDVRVLSPYPSRAELRRREAAGASVRKGLTGSLSVPQVGIASALGLATIAAPLTGSLIPPAATSTSVTATLELAGPAQRSSALGQAPFPLVAAAGVNGVEAPAVVGDDSPLVSIPTALSAPSRVLVTKVSRSNERAVLPGCDGVLPAAAADAKNGQLPAAELCSLWDGDHQLRNDAAVALARLNVAYQQSFGKPLCLADAYRTLAKQYSVKASRGYLAATPGTSEHGWGRAIDLCGGAAVESTTTYTWLRANAPRYGWDNPDWARRGGSGPHEAWHFEYFAGGAGGTSASENEN